MHAPRAALALLLALAACGKSEPPPADKTAATAPTAAELQSCLQDFDCVLYEREPACFGRGNIAVRRDRLDDAPQVFPPRPAAAPLTCDDASREALTRPEAACESQHCVVRFVGQTPPPVADVALGAADPSDAPAPPGDGGGERRYPDGVAPRELIDALVPARVHASPLAMLDTCQDAARIDDERCIGLLDVGAIGLSPDGLVAFITATEIAGCSDFVETSGLTASLPDLTRPTTRSLGTPEDDDATRWASAWGFIAELAKGGFTEPTSLVAKTTLGAAATHGSAWLVALSPPLADWLVYATTSADGVAVHVIAADNTSDHVLGTLPVTTPPCPSPEDREAGLCEPPKDPSILQVVLGPARASLIVTMTLGDGSQCGIDKVYHRAWPLPAGVVISP